MLGLGCGAYIMEAPSPPWRLNLRMEVGDARWHRPSPAALTIPVIAVYDDEFSSSSQQPWPRN